MKNNVTIVGAVLRYSIALFMIILGAYLDSFIIFIAAVVLIVTAITMMCPIYHVLGINKEESY